MGFVSCSVVTCRHCHVKLVLGFCIKVELNLSLCSINHLKMKTNYIYEFSSYIKEELSGVFSTNARKEIINIQGYSK